MKDSNESQTRANGPRKSSSEFRGASKAGGSGLSPDAERYETFDSPAVDKKSQGVGDVAGSAGPPGEDDDLDVDSGETMETKEPPVGGSAGSLGSSRGDSQSATTDDVKHSHEFPTEGQERYEGEPTDWRGSGHHNPPVRSKSNNK